MRNVLNVKKDSVLESIKNRIKYLEYKPGDNLNEKLIAEELQVSRTPVREALLILKGENFVEIFPQSGTYVSKINLNYVKELVYMRHILETEILVNLAHKKLPILNQVEKYLYLQELAIKSNDVVEYITNDDEFHKMLFSIAGHEYIWSVIASTRMHHTRFRVLDMQQPVALPSSYNEHKMIVEYLENNEVDKLGKILSYHHDCELRESGAIIKKYPEYFVEQI